ncbi:helix-turn-helix domain-containing protein [Rhodovarius lipocyclicus]|uniref:helix-turn-helix domain-containing protein n=1 Tax=Rhodovarius lipocyclicus TaxID=268410 RepID=UPI0013571B24|nr:helix-turn-helix transcriptional regulator [Rhodovarius lipocyclicus]
MQIAAYREKHRLTLLAMARRVGVPLTTLYGWEAGTRRPSWDAVAKLEHATSGEITAADFVPKREVA